MSDRMPELYTGDEFIARHIGPTVEGQRKMLDAIGIDSLDTLINQTVPEAIQSDRLLDLQGPISEPDVLSKIRKYADRIKVNRSLMGMGYYPSYTPSVIQRNILENPSWYTAYTPYQPEISQGRLEALLNFQTMVCDLTGLEIANASLLDEATAAAEAVGLCQRLEKSNSNKFN